MAYSIGISGFMGSGKTVGAKYLSKCLNYQLFDGDIEAKRFMDSSLSIKKDINRVFGVVTGGVINYRKLSSIVFADNSYLRQLNSIVHPPFIEFIKERIVSLDSGIIVDAALIPLWGLESTFNKSIWIDSSKELRINRVSIRNSIPEIIARKRIETQEELLLYPSNSIVIKNDQTVAELYKRLEELVYNIG